MGASSSERSAMLVAGLLSVGVACGAAGTLLWHPRDSVAAVDRPLPYVDVTLIDQDGAGRSLSAWSGRLIVLDFVFTGCGDTCPLKTSQLADVQQSLAAGVRERVQFVTVSIDPEHDSPATMKAYAARNGAELSDWAFLTGDLSKVARFAAAFDASPEPNGDVASHITTIRLLDRAGRVVQRYVGEPVDQSRLLRDIEAQAAPLVKQATATPPS